MKKMRLALPKMGKDFFSKLKCKCFGKHPSEPELETQLEERAPSYEEHRLSVEQIAEKNPESNICLSDLSKSQGLTQEEAKQRMEVIA